MFSFVLHVHVFICLACSCFHLSCMFLFSFVLQGFFSPAAQAGLSAQRGVFLQGTRPCVHNRITVLFELTSRNLCRTCCPLALRLSRPGATSLPSVSAYLRHHMRASDPTTELLPCDQTVFLLHYLSTCSFHLTYMTAATWPRAESLQLCMRHPAACTCQ
jgi:hypothetical protein